VKIGYALSSEEHPASVLVSNARRAEKAGFEFLGISDHFHPWTDRQGQSPFVWSVIGAIAAATERIRIGTGVTCPLIRIHPAIIAQAAATSAELLPGRFFLGVGTGENLNEHVLGDRWPSSEERLAMLEEAIEVMRLLWSGEEVSHRGRYYTVDHARIYTLLEGPPPIMVAAKGPNAAELAAKAGDGIVSPAPDADLLETFDKAGGRGKPRYGMLHVCWAESEEEAIRIAREWWPNSALKGEMSLELPLPKHFEQAAALVRPDDISESIVCGPDAKPYLSAIREFVDSGFDHVYLHQVGPDQEGFFGFFERELLPELET
jgi:coenzyme F420-dependent glucose-6-phosphate dehydrogenase